MERILTACMKVEVPAALDRLGIEPQICDRYDVAALAYLTCNEIVKRCAATPETGGCQKVLAGYGLCLPEYRPP